jgi:hypothetical protein
MSRRPFAKAKSPADAAKLIFVLSLLLAFAMRRGLAEGKDQIPWLGVALFALIVLSGGFLLVTACFCRRRPVEENQEHGGSDESPP